MRRTGIDELREAVLDDGSFVSWDTTPPAVPASESYARSWPPPGLPPVWTKRC
ncbi:putative acetyl-coenzyme A carboxylase carboxyl transferase subunit beta domain protein [Mycobacterium xenopi 4042]|uniref:Putative acetyl-coenzyme A carboxylase carboxyl transferase subunit beta domain protein n=1 Tax=Mycobacterium xenopi 4042 TaxID=1299334 RepID=X8AF83_MYCXE|nr:putative acetyl-coenzyme A carboxylase carboxyl transferase subunit beta domain protein [Mycobacterium xenopi 4042]